MTIPSTDDISQRNVKSQTGCHTHNPTKTNQLLEGKRISLRPYSRFPVRNAASQPTQCILVFLVLLLLWCPSHHMGSPRNLFLGTKTDTLFFPPNHPEAGCVNCCSSRREGGGDKLYESKTPISRCPKTCRSIQVTNQQPQTAGRTCGVTPVVF